MLRISTRHIGWSVCRMILLIFFILAALQFVMGFVGDLSSIGKGSYTFLLSLYCLILSLPMQLYSLFSVVAFLGVVLSLGLLVQRNELVVYRASGLSLYRLLSIVMLAVLTLLIVVTCMGELLAPRLNKLAVSLKQQALYHPSQLVHHFWWQDKNRLYFIRSAEKHNTVSDLVSLDMHRSGKAAKMTYAKTAEKQGNNWAAKDTSVTELRQQLSQSNHLYNATIPDKLHVNSSQIARHQVNQESVFNLKQVIDERKKEGRSFARFQVAYWGRELQPVATLVLVLLGVPLVFTQLRRSSGASRLLIGITIGFTFYLINQLLAPVGVLLQWPPTLVVLLPITVFLAIGLYFMRRVSHGQ